MLEENFQKEYLKLNKAQQEAVDLIDGPVAVVAGPGTGKTKILTFRIANILRKTDTAPESILALTYTTAGVISMREKLIQIIGDRAYRVNIFTFHAFCEYIIKEFSFYFENLEYFRVISDLERVEIIEKIIQENKFKFLVSFNDEFSFLNKIISAILIIKQEGLSPDEFINKLPSWKKELLANENIYYKKNYGKYKKGEIKLAEKEKIDKKIEKTKELAEIFKLYQSEIKKRNLYDFSDMILYVLEELVKNKDLKADLQEKYQYILVDEHQDTNEGQNTLVELLTDAPHLEKKPNIFTVGDEKQSIYRFQGASAQTFSRFQDLYKDIKYISLSQNYRSSQNILDGAHSLITKVKNLEKSIKLNSNHNLLNEKINNKIQVNTFSSYKFELLYLAQDIKTKIDKGISPSDIAVLYRANKNVADIKTIFDFYKIPYTIFSKDKILDDFNIANLINILRVIFNFYDDVHLGKVFFVNFLNFDAHDSVKILDKFNSLRKYGQKHLFDILESEEILKEIEVKNINIFLNFAQTLKELKIESENNNFLDFFKIFLKKINYIAYMISSIDSRSQLIKLDKFLEEIKKQNEIKKNYHLSDFIYFIDSFLKYNLDIKNNDPEIIEGVSLMTAHSSKGREFSDVYIINATRKSWENNSGGNNIVLPIYQYGGEIEDEKRLFYVAMTRAQNNLTISFSKLDNNGRNQEESEFVKEIDISFKEEQVMKNFEEKNIDKLFSFINFEKKINSIFDKDYLIQLFLKRGLNVSALNNYLNCPKKYFYKNLIRIPDSYSSTLIFGNIIHKTLELFFKNINLNEKILPKDELIKQFYKIIEKSNLTEKDEEKFKITGQEILSSYYDQYAFNWITKIKVESSFKREFILNNKEKIQLSGKIDKIEFLNDFHSGKINIIDYKTGKPFSEKNKEQKADYERQIIFYHLLLEDYDNNNFFINKSCLDFLTKNKKGEFEQYSFIVTKEHLDNLKNEINQMAQSIFSMKFLEQGCNKKDCEWCHIER